MRVRYDVSSHFLHSQSASALISYKSAGIHITKGVHSVFFVGRMYICIFADGEATASHSFGNERC